MRLVNARTGTAVASLVELAVTRADRRRGLLGRETLAPSAALILAPCAAVHTVCMRFPIDVVFVDRDGCVRKIVHDLRPWRMAVSPRAWAAVELAGGGARDLIHGDCLRLLNDSGER
jgi:uncharacterized membrane protein (UPF0127 family)